MFLRRKGTKKMAKSTETFRQKLLSIFFNLNQCIGQNGHHTACRNPRREDIPYCFRQLRKYFGNQLYTQPETETDGYYQRSLAVDVLRSDDADTCRCYRTEHQQGGSSQHRFGHQREYQTHHREQTQQYQHTGNEIAYITAGYPRQLNHTIILGKDGVRERIEDTCQHGIEAIGQDTSRSTLHELLAFHRLYPLL